MFSVRKIISLTILAVFFSMSLLSHQYFKQTQLPLSTDEIPKSSQLNVQVVCSISIIEDFVANLVNNTGVFTYSSLISGQEDPHTYEATQSDLNRLIQADVLLIFNNSDLEPFWVAGHHDHEEGEHEDHEEETTDPAVKVTVLKDNPNLQVISITNSTMEKYDPFIKTVNSHMWMDPMIGKMMVQNIYLGLKPLITDSAALTIFEANYHTYQTRLDQLISDLNALKSSWPGPTKVIETHPANYYLLQFMGIQTVDVVEKKHDVEPSPVDIRAVITNMSTTQTRFILQQSDIDPKSALSIARDSELSSLNVVIVPTAPLLGLIGYDGKPVETYIEMIKYNVEALLHPFTPDEYEEFWKTVVSPTIDGYTLELLLLGFCAVILSIIRINQKRKF